MPLDARHDTGEQLMNDLKGGQFDRRVSPEIVGRDHQVVTDQLTCVLVGPHATVGFDQCVLGGHPVGLGVDESAVHVPENRSRKGAGHVATELSIVRGGPCSVDVMPSSHVPEGCFALKAMSH